MTKLVPTDGAITAAQRITAANPERFEVVSTGISPKPPKGAGWIYHGCRVAGPEHYWYREKRKDGR